MKSLESCRTGEKDLQFYDLRCNSVYDWSHLPYVVHSLRRNGSLPFRILSAVTNTLTGFPVFCEADLQEYLRGQLPLIEKTRTPNPRSLSLYPSVRIGCIYYH